VVSREHLSRESDAARLLFLGRGEHDSQHFEDDVHLKSFILSSSDTKCRLSDLPRHDGPQIGRKSWRQLLSRPGWQSSIRVHKTTADNVGRQLSGRVELKWTRQFGEVSWHGRQSGVEL